MAPVRAFAGRPRPCSSLEHRCWVLLQAAGLAPLKQYPIAEPTTGRLITSADFAFPDRRVAARDSALPHDPVTLRTNFYGFPCHNCESVAFSAQPLCALRISFLMLL
jgi:hypothetical protein